MSPAPTTACTLASGAGSRTGASAALSILTGNPRAPLVSDWGGHRVSRAPPQVIPRTARAGSFVIPIPTCPPVFETGCSSSSTPPRAVRCPRTSVGLNRDFRNQSLGMGLFLVRLPGGGLPPAGTGCGPPGDGWQQVSCTGRARRPSEKKATHFLELFAGAGGLTAAVRRLNLPAFESQDLLKSDESGFNRHFDLGADEHFKQLRWLCRRGSVRWLHGAPPCKTFSRARRTDAHARSRILRSDEVLEGFEPKRQIGKEANLLASRMARLARCIRSIS